MTKGKITIRIMRRLVTTSKRFQDKYRREDMLVLLSFVDNLGKRRFKVHSLKKGFQPYIISRDELAFVRLLYLYYRDGDYYIQMWGKGKERGFRTFWDGMITPNRTFFRRRVNVMGMKTTIKQRETYATHASDYIGRFMKTKRSGKWWSF